MFIVKNSYIMFISYWLCISIVTSDAQWWILLCTSAQLLLELIEMLLRDWIDGTTKVPVYTSLTWWWCHRSIVSISVINVEQVHKISVVHGVCNWCACNLIPFHAIKEAVNHLPLDVIDGGIVSLGIKHNTNHTILDASLRLISKMNCMHFEVVSDSIDCVLRSRMEVVLNCSKFSWSLVI